MPHPIHRVARFEIAGPYTLSVTFADGTSQEIDFQPVLHGALFGPLRDLSALCRESLLPVLRLYVNDPEHLNRTRGNACGYSPAALRNMNRSGSAGGASQQRTTRRCS